MFWSEKKNFRKDFCTEKFFGPSNIFGPKKFLVKDNFLVQKLFWSNFILIWNINFGPGNFFGWKIIFIKKNFWSENFFGPEKIVVRKKKFSPKKCFGPNFFLDRIFLKFNWSHIFFGALDDIIFVRKVTTPNLSLLPCLEGLKKLLVGGGGMQTFFSVQL